MPEYQHRSEVVLAAQWNGSSTPELQEVLGGTGLDPALLNRYGTVSGGNAIVTSDGEPIPLGSWIVNPSSSHEPYILPPTKFDVRFEVPNRTSTPLP